MPIIHGYAASEAKGSLKPFEFDLGELGPEEVEIKVTHCGICHSDLSMLDNEWGMSKYPFVPGHEAAGTVVAMPHGMLSRRRIMPSTPIWNDSWRRESALKRGRLRRATSASYRIQLKSLRGN